MHRTGPQRARQVEYPQHRPSHRKIGSGLHPDQTDTRTMGFGFRVSGLGFRVSGLGFRVQGRGCETLGRQVPVLMWSGVWALK